MKSKIPDIRTYIKARFTALWIPTIDELRVTAAIAEAARLEAYKVVTWDCVDGITRLDGKVENASLVDPEAALRWLRQVGGPTEAANPQKLLVVFRDIHRWLNAPSTIRLLRSTAQSLQGGYGSAIFLVPPDAKLPEDLTAEVTKLNWPLPDREEIGQMLDSAGAAYVEVLQAQRLSTDDLAASLKNGRRERIIDAALGLADEQVRQALAFSFASSAQIDAEMIKDEKAAVVAGIPGMTWWESDPRGLDGVGGMGRLKQWLIVRRNAFSEKARTFGLPKPKGLLLLGHPGGGKSLVAKSISATWQVPLIRLDLGGAKRKFVGESEGNIRRALQLADTVSSCVLWIDEIEKALAGSSGAAGDGGVAADALGTLLSWMQEKTSSVFVLATANDVSALPPELLRKGRFDEIFFVDLPNQAERAEILAVCLKLRNRDVASFDLRTLAASTNGFVGAELQAIVDAGMYTAFDAGRELTTADIEAAAAATQPLSKTAAEKIEALQTWAKGRTQSVSLPEQAAASGGVVRQRRVIAG